MALYPEINHLKTYTISVDKPHELYVEECGSPNGIPVIFIHGGPGSACNASHRRYFNPEFYRIILFDQRGCGRSKPHGCLDGNTTGHLLADIELIRQELKVEQWVIFAGSWGVTLSLLYAQRHPERTLGMILRGAFLASFRDYGWFFNDGASRIFPELWDALDNALPKLSADETLLQRYQRCLHSDDIELNKKAAKAWSDWTDTIVTWTLHNDAHGEQSNDQESASGNTSNDIPSNVSEKPSTTSPPPEAEYVGITEKQIRSIRIEVHYAINQYFLDDGHLLKNMDAIKHIPTRLIHGRKDITCPVESSWKLHKQLANSELKILENTGHLSIEPAMVEALVGATDEMLIKLSPHP